MFKLIKNILFPKYCLNCKKFGTYICSSCQKGLLLLENSLCFYCEKESPKGFTHEQCVHLNGVDRFMSVFHYNGVLKKILANIKYRLVSDGFEDIFLLLKPEVQNKCMKEVDLSTPLYFQPVPLHKNRQKQRGFNQSEIIAKWLAKEVDGRNLNVLTRVKETKTQAQLGREERIVNAKGAFSVRKGPDIKGLSIVIVDDVVTTGSTVSEAATLLKQAGAAEVYVFSIAKG
ncbi:MAG: ComF family protein [Patescibacteria group bacterium]